MSRSTTLLGGNLGIGGNAGAGGNPVGAAVGVQGFVSATNHLRTNVGDIMPGDVNGFFASVLVHILAVPTVYPQLFGSGVYSSRGWMFLPSVTNMMFRGTTAAGAAFVSTPSTIGAGDVGKILKFDGMYDPVAGGTARLYRAGSALAPIIVPGYLPSNITDRAFLGNDYAGTSPLTWGRIVGTLYGTGIPQPADVLAHYNACKAANTMESMGGVGVTNINRWQAKDNLPNAATWTDDIGGMVLNKTGTLSSVIFTPTWE